jgi:cystathionine beta-lyase/cystathionine gamma-synthase
MICTNPTVKILQQKIAALEKTDAALVFASGSAAVAAAVMGNCKAGDHILCVSKPYSWSNKLISTLLPRFGVEHTFSDATDHEQFLEEVTSSTRIIYLESPNSWTYEMQDLEAIGRFARDRDIITIIDNSYASPMNQQPAEYGIDLVLHSATKYLGGHSDLVAGVLCGSKEMMEKLFKSEYMTLGGVISPFDAWLMIRSLRTLPMRMKHIGESTLQVVKAIESHPKIKAVYYPFAESFKQKDLAAKYLKGPSGLFTIDLDTLDERKIEKFCDHLKLFRMGCSWGSYESLAFPAITTMTSLNYDNPNTVAERVRLSVGLDEPEALISDLENALEVI